MVRRVRLIPQPDRALFRGETRAIVQAFRGFPNILRHAYLLTEEADQGNILSNRKLLSYLNKFDQCLFVIVKEARPHLLSGAASR